MKVLDLFEARDKKLPYTEKRNKTTKALERVTVELEGNKSGIMSKLTTRYSRLDKAAKLMQARRNDLNEEMKKEAAELFDAEDEIATRVVETISYTITLSKAERGADKPPKKTVNYEAIVKALEKMVPELTEKIKELTDQYTSIVEAADTPQALRVKSKLDEGVFKKALAWVKAFLNDIKSWGNDYDTRLAALKKQL